ncbi:zinc-binding dehydrogenase [Streptomyces nigra]|uniref:zinc-binding dehydrogenase n=1 Tax=Streptomyces nigra TaxID=1827580 RepID=UPI00342D3B0C
MLVASGIADAAHGRDRDVVTAAGADHLVPRGEGFADAVLRLRPGGVDGLIDTAQFTGAADAAVRDGAVIAALRPVAGAAAGCGLRRRDVNVIEHSADTRVLAALRDHVESGALTLRVAAAFAPEEAAQAHAFLEKGGVRSRPVIVF